MKTAKNINVLYKTDRKYGKLISKIINTQEILLILKRIADLRDMKLQCVINQLCDLGEIATMGYIYSTKKLQK